MATASMFGGHHDRPTSPASRIISQRHDAIPTQMLQLKPRSEMHQPLGSGGGVRTHPLWVWNVSKRQTRSETRRGRSVGRSVGRLASFPAVFQLQSGRGSLVFGLTLPIDSQFNLPVHLKLLLLIVIIE